MLQLLWVTAALPFIGAFVLALFGRQISKLWVAVTGVASIGLSALISLGIAVAFLLSPTPYLQVLWTWINVDGFQPQISLYLDPVSLLMLVVVTWVSFFIHLYSAEFMEEDEGYSRFFAYMNLFVGSMVVLVLANNLLLLYLGWEGVGLCSYLLIGFWYQDEANGLAARKAFIVTRVGDTAFIVGLFLLFHQLGTLNIQELMHRASIQWAGGSPYAVAAAALLLGGAVGKSAQLPLQTWLPDAMAGPTPTSALIHAATMVTAGVYLIARTHVLYTLAPSVQLAVAVIGAATLLLAGCSALTQTDIKRVLAYSTISQIGYMFLALGVGSWAAGLFHFMTHAFFKALLFLAAGIVIEALHHEHNIFRMGGLARRIPIAFWTFLIGGCALAGLPVITSGYWSKDFILWSAWTSPKGDLALWVAGIVGVLLTSLYIFRLIFLVFFGDERTAVTRRPRKPMIVPVVVLSVFTLFAGFTRSHLISFLDTALPPLVSARTGFLSEALSAGISAAAFVVGVALAYLFFMKQRGYAAVVAKSAVGSRVRTFWFAAWGFDWLYDRVFVRPVVWFATAGKSDIVRYLFDGIAVLSRSGHLALSRSENGRLRLYAAVLSAGAVVYVGIVLFR
ncbi:MAG TPA: NADH-quinone oxidoreductase subunit L [Bryobacteraceae bacterium]